MSRPTRIRAIVPLLIAAVVVLVVDHLVFGPDGPYWKVAKPHSYAGKVAIVRTLLEERPADPERTVLFLGDSRIRVGLAPLTVERAADDRIDAELAAVEGTRMRLWSHLVRRLDPDADRYAAVVVPILEPNERDVRFTGGDDTLHPERSETDLRAMLPLVQPWDAPRLLSGVDTWETVAPTLRTLFLKGLVYRDDLVDFVADPDVRRRAVESQRRAVERSHDAGRGMGGTLAGLRYMPARERFQWPRRRVTPLARERIEASVLLGGVPESQEGRRAAYLRRWLGAIVDHYEGSSTRVVLLPIPRAPLVRAEDREAPVAGYPLELADAERVILLDQEPVRALEQPRWFADHVHLNMQGRTEFSEFVGRALAERLDVGAEARGK